MTDLTDSIKACIDLNILLCIISVHAGKHKGSVTVTKEMKKHGLNLSQLEHIIAIPTQFQWNLPMPPSIKFYADLQSTLKKRRIPVNEIGSIYRSIDQELCRSTTTSKEAYKKVQDLILTNRKEHTAHDVDLVDDHHFHSGKEVTESSDENEGQPTQFSVRNVKRREKRAKTKIAKLQKFVKYFKRINKRQQSEIENLSASLDGAKSIINSRNIQIKNLQGMVQSHELTIDMLEYEMECISKETDQESERYKHEIADLEAIIKQLQEKHNLLTFSSRTYNTNVRALYYALLSMRLPPAQIQAVVRNVLSHLLPSINTDDLRLPGKSCASYMRSQEMPTISLVQKGSELMQEQQWHLNSDGTTLMQQKKVAFLINKMVFGVHDVPDGSSEAALDALKAEVAKTSKFAAELSPDDNFSIDRIVSSTSDSAATQKKFTHLLEEETGKQIVENKCGMHLGVNLRLAQVKAVAALALTHNSDDELEAVRVNAENGSSVENEPSTSDVEEESDDSESGSCSSENSSVVELERTINRDIDLFVHELAKLFGHLGTPEYCNGVSKLPIFIVNKIKESTGSKKGYYESAQKIVLERQVGNRYYVTSCNAGRLYFLRDILVAFLKEQNSIKLLNRLESTCLQKLQDSLLLTNLRLEGLLFDKVYADLMTLVKSTELNKSALDMNIHYKELLEFFNVLIMDPSALLDPGTLVFKSEPLLYSESSKLNHRLIEKYIPVRRELLHHQDSDRSLLFPMIIAASNAMQSKIQTYMKDYLPGGHYYDPEPTLGSILSKLQPHNDRVESIFGANDWLNRILPNLAQSTRSTMLEFSFNKTMNWLKEKNKKQKQTLIALAQARRNAVQKETKEEKKYLFQKKCEERKRIVEQSQLKEKQIKKQLDDIKYEFLIPPVKELDLRVASITSLTIPKTLQDAELKKLIQRQVQLRTLVYQQKGIKINMTEKGKPRPVLELLKDLSTIITERPVRVRKKESTHLAHQQLFVVFSKPSLLKGVKIKHRFNEGGSLRWYEGTIISSTRDKWLTVHYHETDEKCLFTLNEIEEDFFSGDLYIM